jgi:integral membrane sensor domain MASE1
MVLAALFHVTRREWPNVLFNLVLGAIAAFVAYARFAVPLS